MSRNIDLYLAAVCVCVQNHKIDHCLSSFILKVPNSRPCRMYFVETIGEVMERAWVPGNVMMSFKGGYQFKDLPVLRRRGKQKEKDYHYTVNWQSQEIKRLQNR